MSTAATAQSFKEQGNAKFQAQQYADAVQLYTQAIALDGNNAVLYSNRSVSHLSLGQAQEALADAQQATDLRPDWDKGHFRRGAALEEMGQLKEALAAFDHALQLSPLSQDVIRKVRQLKDKCQPASTTPQAGPHAHPDGPQQRMPAGAGGPAAGGVQDTPSSWAQGLTPPQQAEWLVDCYRIRLDDEYENKAMSGKVHIKTRGLYDINRNFPDEARSTIAEDFLVFCQLAVWSSVVPQDWDWALFLSTAATLLPHIFERSDCRRKWGHDFVFFSPLLGRSLKHTGEVVYGSSLLGGSTEGDGGREYSIWRNKVLGRWQQLAQGDGKMFESVDGVELWRQLHRDMVIVPPTNEQLTRGMISKAIRQMRLR